MYHIHKKYSLIKHVMCFVCMFRINSHFRPKWLKPRCLGSAHLVGFFVRQELDQCPPPPLMAQQPLVSQGFFIKASRSH